MNTVKIKLKSNKDEEVEVPCGCMMLAETLSAMIVKAKSENDLVDTILRNPFLKNKNIESRVKEMKDFNNDPEREMRLKDEIYLRTCLYAVKEIYGDDAKYLIDPIRAKIVELGLK